MTNLAGIPIVFSEYAGTYADVTVKRGWRERLLTRPWRPLARTKTISEFKPGIFVMDRGGMTPLFGVPISNSKVIVAHLSLKNSVEQLHCLFQDGIGRNS